MHLRGKILLFSGFIFILGCKSMSSNEDPMIREAKWITYALNHNKKAIDRTDKEPPPIDFIEASAVETSKKNLSEDTVEVLFSFAYKRTFNKANGNYYLARPYHCPGVLIINKEALYPICDIDFMWKQGEDSVRNFIKHEEQEFKKYLKAYEGEMNDWLKGEAKRRGVIE